MSPRARAVIDLGKLVSRSAQYLPSPVDALPPMPRDAGAGHLSRPVSVLFCRHDSNYFKIPGVEVYDETRDARTFAGGTAVVAHPPCRAWSVLRNMAKPNPGEAELAFFALERVRECGGVLEHPFKSDFWRAADLPPVNESDEWGTTLQVEQFWWGHPAAKATWLYVAGLDRSMVPPAPLVFSRPGRTVESISKPMREHTPPDFAEFLVSVASRCARPGYTSSCRSCGWSPDHLLDLPLLIRGRCIDCRLNDDDAAA